VKKHADGSTERYKAYLVARGFKLRYGLDYKNTFSHPFSSQPVLAF
jgi:hypothetical protein